MSSVNVRYFYPNDVPLDPLVAERVTQVMAHVQAWYASKLGGRTFSMSAVEVVKGEQPAAYYQPVWGQVFRELAVRKLVPNVCSGPVNGPDPYGINVIFTHASLDVNGGTPCSSLLGPDGVTSWFVADGGGLAMFSEGALERPGQIIHEIGHALTLPHTSFCEGIAPGHPDYGTCTRAIMWSAWNDEEGGFVDDPRAPEIATLLRHPLIDITIPVETAPEPLPAPTPEPVPTPTPTPEPCPEPECTGDPSKPGKGRGRGKRRNK